MPLRILVTGTRGKSSVTRLIAGALRESGRKVLAKTTGSKPVLIFPDGTEREIDRPGIPSILEGKNVLAEAAKLGARAVVAEMMSIRPESLAVESGGLFRPQTLVITNVRLDHLPQMGKTREEIAECFASAIPERCDIFVPEKEFFPVYEERAESSNSKMIRVSRDAFLIEIEKHEMIDPFTGDIQLALAVAESLGIDSGTALEGMKKALPDFGSLKAWTARSGILSKTCLLVSAFAANDPESTMSALEFLKRRGAFDGKKLVALLNFRRDRGDRTLQWLQAARQGLLSDFHRTVYVGGHARLFLRRSSKGLKRIESLAFPHGSPREITASSVFPGEDNVVVGMGNMGGAGKKIVAYWEKIGEPHGL